MKEPEGNIKFLTVDAQGKRLFGTAVGQMQRPVHPKQWHSIQG
jgi:hypothetical protein